MTKKAAACAIHWEHELKNEEAKRLNDIQWRPKTQEICVYNIEYINMEHITASFMMRKQRHQWMTRK